MFFYLFIFVLGFSSCARFEYINEALALRSFAAEKDAQQVFVVSQDKSFDLLYREVCQAGSFREKLKLDKDGIRKIYGEPVLVEKRSDGERWLYRKTTQYFNVPRIYVSFDEKDVFANVCCVN